MRCALLTVLICGSLIARPASSPESPFDPTSVYKRESVHGFTVLVNPEVSTHKREAAEMRKELDSQLAAISREMPANRLSVLRKVWVWVEWEKQKNRRGRVSSFGRVVEIARLQPGEGRPHRAIEFAAFRRVVCACAAVHGAARDGPCVSPSRARR